MTLAFASPADRLAFTGDASASLSELPVVSPPPACPNRGREVNNVTKLFTLFKREEGQTMAEYGVVLAVITLGVILALTALSGGISNAINNVVGNL